MSRTFAPFSYCKVHETVFQLVILKAYLHDTICHIRFWPWSMWSNKRAYKCHVSSFAIDEWAKNGASALVVIRQNDNRIRQIDRLIAKANSQARCENFYSITIFESTRCELVSWLLRWVEKKLSSCWLRPTLLFYSVWCQMILLVKEKYHSLNQFNRISKNFTGWCSYYKWKTNLF